MIQLRFSCKPVGGDILLLHGISASGLVFPPGCHYDVAMANFREVDEHLSGIQ